jgi:hypothetical protein
VVLEAGVVQDQRWLGWVGLGKYISNLNLLVAILSLHTLSLEPRFHALIVSYI